MTTLAAEVTEREYVSQRRGKTFGFEVYQDGALGDPDDNEVWVTMLWVPTKDGEDLETVFANRSATRADEGVYTISLTSLDTARAGVYSLVWDYKLDDAQERFIGYVEVGKPAPVYDALAIQYQAVVESVLMRFDDAFDSALGGPHLQQHFQANFGRNRVAKLLHIAMGDLNMASAPHAHYTIAGPKFFPVEKWGPMLERALYIQVLKHLIRSYVEQPAILGVSIAHHDRRDYIARWRQVLDMETAEWRDNLDTYRMAHMGLGTPHVLVAGGVYGQWGPTRAAGFNAARPRFWARFY